MSTSSEKDSDSSAPNSCELNYNTLTLSHHRISETEDERYERKLKFKEDRKSVVSYDSIYLSSEGSNEHTIVDESLEDPLPEIRVNAAGEFYDIEIDELNEEKEKTVINIDSLYSQINKTKPKIVSLEPKSKLTSFSDTSTRGTLERLTFITTSSTAQQKEFKQSEGKLLATEPFVGALIENQYCSLPDANIGVSLRASERIDAKLRLSCNGNVSVNGDCVEDKQNIIYDSISRFGRAHKRLRQRESFEIVVLNPISIDEQPREAPSIEVSPEQPIEKDNSHITDIVVEPPVEIPPPPPPPPQIVETKRKQPVLPTTISLGKKQVIVDELAAKVYQTQQIKDQEAHQCIKSISSITLKSNEKISETKETAGKSEIKIIVTDSQNNIVEETYSEVVKKKNWKTDPVVESISKSAPPKFKQNEEDKNATLDIIKPKLPSEVKKEETKVNQTIEILKNKIQYNETTSEIIRNEFKANLTDTLKKRIAQSRNTFNARPIRISSVENLSKLNDTAFEIHPSLTYKVKIKENSSSSTDHTMPRPQILNVTDTKRNVCSVAPRPQNGLTDIDDTTTTAVKHPVVPTNNSGHTEVQQEFLEKVDSVRCYWSKLVEEKELLQGLDVVDSFVPIEKEKQETQNNIVESLANHESIPVKKQQLHQFNPHTRMIRDNDNDITSFSPIVEIIELDGHRQAAIVNAQNMDNQDFDHVRYKVMKSDTFQKNILAHTRKEAQFDGLLQYLHNYSFQVGNYTIHFG